MPHSAHAKACMHRAAPERCLASAVHSKHTREARLTWLSANADLGRSWAPQRWHSRRAAPEHWRASALHSKHTREARLIWFTANADFGRSRAPQRWQSRRNFVGGIGSRPGWTDSSVNEPKLRYSRISTHLVTSSETRYKFNLETTPSFAMCM